jgi:molybdate transport system regulatory protein
MTDLKMRLYFDDESWIGPGKVRLLELIAEHGSISAAGRAMNMSYKRAWDLVAEMNRIFGEPVAVTQSGGKSGGGADVTPLGRSIIEHFRALEHDAMLGGKPHIGALAKLARGAKSLAASADVPAGSRRRSGARKSQPAAGRDASEVNGAPPDRLRR